MQQAQLNPYFWGVMNKEFFLNIIFLITVNLLIKPFFIFGIDRTVQNTVGTENYGIYFVLLNFTYLFQIINDFGIQNYNNRQIAQHNQLLDKYFPNILVLKLLLGLLFLGLVLSIYVCWCCMVLISTLSLGLLLSIYVCWCWL